MAVDFKSPVSEDDIERVFNIALKRSVNNDSWKAHTAASGITFQCFLAQVLESEEFKAKYMREAGPVVPSVDRLDDYRFRLPDDLELSKPKLKKIALIGSCLLNNWTKLIQSAYPDVSINRIVFNNASQLPAMERDEATEYDFQILQIPLRSILSEAAFYNLKFSDKEAHEKLFASVCQLMKLNLDSLLAYNERFGMLSFVLNFHLPQQNPMGRMIDRYSLTNMVYFVEELNKKLHDFLSSRKNCYVVDVDQISSTFGKKYFQDDSVLHINHGSSLTDIRVGADHLRLESVGDIHKTYTPNPEKYILSIYHEILAQYKTLQQTDVIKLVIFDLDDTLWRGVAAEVDDVDSALVEGWPLGIVEAASYLWKRGILIAIVSKNDEMTARDVWDKVHRGRFNMKNFVSIKINWRSKVDNIREILEETNLLSSSVLFVDDNPVERAGVKEAFRDIRLMDAALIHWRRILLWSTELQRAVLTDEALARTEMIKAQINREEERAGMSHEVFLMSLQTQIKIFKIADTAHKKFARCFELLNKTNQFNTTGRRWKVSEIEAVFVHGGYFLAIKVCDKYSDYGITGLLIIQNYTIEQFVLSCRVFGMQIEQAAVAVAHRLVGAVVIGKIVPTEKNILSLDLYRNLKFIESKPGVWSFNQGEINVPAQISVDMGDLNLPDDLASDCKSAHGANEELRRSTGIEGRP